MGMSGGLQDKAGGKVYGNVNAMASADSGNEHGGDSSTTAGGYQKMSMNSEGTTMETKAHTASQAGNFGWGGIGW